MVDSETTHWSPLYYQPRKILTQPAGHGKQDIPSHPHPAFADFSAIPEREQNTHTHKNCHSWCKHRRGRSLPCYFSDVYLAFPNMSFKYNQAAPRASKRYIIQCLSISLSPTLSTSACPLSFFVSAVLHLPLIFSLGVPFPCAATWTVSAACNANYCAVFRSGKQRGEITDVWSTAL